MKIIKQRISRQGTKTLVQFFLQQKAQQKTQQKQRGFSLIELMITIAIAGILMSLALPSFKKTLQNSKLISMHNELLSSLSLTRNIAISRGSFATLCKSNQAGDDCDSDASWKDGWIIFLDRDNNGSVNNDEEVIALNNALPKNVTIKFSRDRVTYGAQGYAIGYSGTVTFCDDLHNGNKRGMLISSNGHIRVATSDSELENCSN